MTYLLKIYIIMRYAKLLARLGYNSKAIDMYLLCLQITANQIKKSCDKIIKHIHNKQLNTFEA